MAGGKLAGLHQLRQRRGELQQPQGVCHRRAGAAHLACGLLLGQTVLADQAVKAPGLFHGVEILALEVLDQGQLHHLAIVGLENSHRDLLQPCKARCAPSALAGDDLVVAAFGLADGKRLDHPVLCKRVCQGLQRLGVKLLARLHGVGLHPLQGQGGDRLAGLAEIQRGVAQQGAESPSKAGLFFLHVSTFPLL